MQPAHDVTSGRKQGDYILCWDSSWPNLTRIQRAREPLVTHRNHPSKVWSQVKKGRVDRSVPTTKLLPLGQKVSPSRTLNVGRCYCHHITMHLAHKFKVAPTEYRKITAKPSQAGTQGVHWRDAEDKALPPGMGKRKTKKEQL